MLWHVIASFFFFLLPLLLLLLGPGINLNSAPSTTKPPGGKKRQQGARVGRVFPCLLITTASRFSSLLPCTNSPLTQKPTLSTWKSKAAAQTRWTCCAHPLMHSRHASVTVYVMGLLCGISSAVVTHLFRAVFFKLQPRKPSLILLATVVIFYYKLPQLLGEKKKLRHLPDASNFPAPSHNDDSS